MINETAEIKNDAPTQQVAPNNELLSGFGSAEELIGYCEIHCTTERALFSGKQIIDILRLADDQDGWESYIDPTEWLSMHEEMAELCEKARARLAR